MSHTFQLLKLRKPAGRLGDLTEEHVVDGDWYGAWREALRARFPGLRWTEAPDGMRGREAGGPRFEISLRRDPRFTHLFVDASLHAEQRAVVQALAAALGATAFDLRTGEALGSPGRGGARGDLHPATTVGATMGHWENTTYVQHGDAVEVARCLAALFAKERMAQVEAPRRRVHPGLGEPMQYADALHNDLWGVAAFPGAPSWTVVKTAPLELLGERRPGADRMRLAEACAVLGASAIQVNVYDSVGIVLVEVSPEGAPFLSGFNDRGPDNFAWHSERIDEAMVMPQLVLHPFREVLGDGMNSRKIAVGLAQRLGGANADFCDNGVSVDTLVTHGPLGARGGRVAYFRWAGPSRVGAKPKTGRR